ncbi:MAG: glutathione S-transferase [Gammaproteobacteria bacterium]|nr:glutathione S-transferase [Gammaproteobacteria bacterium]
MDIELFQFRFSHYNEKARWALDYKGIPHRRTDLLPGPHRGFIKKLTGQTATPVLRIGASFVAGSSRIIERLEREFPDSPPLLPADPDLRDQALELERHFDLVFGPAARVLVFDATLAHRNYVPLMFAQSKPRLTRFAYRAIFPLTRGLIAKANGLTAHDALFHAQRHVTDNMASLERLARRGAYLVNDAFSVADLTAAALMAPLIDPPHPDMHFPTPKPQPLVELHEAWRAHPAGQWALGIYAKHRTRISSP